MPRSSGVFTLTTGLPVGTGTIASSTVVNTCLDDIASGLTQSIAKDGQTPATADLPMGTFKHTGVGNATARTHYPSVGQLQDGTLVTLGSVAGTNTITGACSPAIPAYVNGMRLSFKPANTNTDAATIAINGLSAIAIVKGTGAPLKAGDLAASVPATIVYDGTRFFLQSPAATGSFTGTLTGMTGSVTVAIDYVIANGLCALRLQDSANHTGTSNTTAMTMLGAPAAVWPAYDRFSPCLCRNAGGQASAWGQMGTGGTITFFRGDDLSTGFSSFSTKGLAAGWNMVYPL